MNISINNGLVISPATGMNQIADLFIADGVIIAIGQKPDGFVADQDIDASDQLVCPGFIDLYARLREPGQEYKATISSETAAAAKGGFTSICCMPDTTPVIDTRAIAEFIQHHAQKAGYARVFPLGALTQGLQGEQLSSYGALKAAGCLALSQAEQPIMDTRVLRHCFEYAATHDLTVFIDAHDPWLTMGTCMHESDVSTRLGLNGQPAIAEHIGITRYLYMIQLTGVKAHFNKLSSAHAVTLIAQAQRNGLRVTADVAINQLFFTVMDVSDFDSQFHLQPPLREESDQRALIDGLRTGVISAIVSDHQPHERDAKMAPFAESATGMATLETVLPFALRLTEHKMTLNDIIATLTSHPAKIIGVENDYGTLAINSPADITVFNPKQHWQVTPENWLSRGENTAFWNWELLGQVTHTLVAGKVTYQKS
jgi:dihydroorotase